MSNGWWSAGQRYTAPDGSICIVRAYEVLYLKPKGEETFRELITIDNLSNVRNGHFRFEDYPTGRKGFFVCSEDACTVQFEGEEPLAYEVSPGYNMEKFVRLDEFDEQQVPASLFMIDGTAQMIYFSRWAHSASDFTPRRMFIVDGDNIEEASRPLNRTALGEVLLTMEVYDKQYIVMPRPSHSGNAQWGEQMLTQLNLADYMITHDEELGDLTGIVPKV